MPPPPRGPDLEVIYQQLQRQIVNQYRMMKASGVVPYPDLRDAGFRAYSQFEEDGIILYVLAMTGFETRKVVEMCVGQGDECMATNLVLNHGFEGFLFDGSERNIARAQRFFKSKKDCLLYLPRLKQAWITRENVNELLTQIGAVGEVDLFSLDIDGNDYWVWQAIEVMQPRLCVFETSNLAPSNASVTIEYKPDFSYEDAPHPDYRSVSLKAMVKLSKKKGYRMIGAHRHGFNVFFLRNDIAPELFPEVSIEQVHDNLWTRFSQRQRWPKVKDLNWVKV